MTDIIDELMRPDGLVEFTLENFGTLVNECRRLRLTKDAIREEARDEIERLERHIKDLRELRECDRTDIERLHAAMRESGRMHVETQDLMQAEIERLKHELRRAGVMP